MSLSAVFKNMAKQAVDCKNMVRVKVWHTHTPLSGYSKITVNDLDLTYGRTMAIRNAQKVHSVRVLKFNPDEGTQPRRR